jgi:hypothetical protein
MVPQPHPPLALELLSASMLPLASASLSPPESALFPELVSASPLPLASLWAAQALQ